MHVDWNGLAVFLGAFGAFLGSATATVISFLNWRDARKEKQNAARRERTLNAVAQTVGVTPEEHNGQNP